MRCVLGLFGNFSFVVEGSTELPTVYTSEKAGSDETGDGTEGKPFKTVLQAMRHAGREPFPVIFVDGKEEGKVRFLLWF